MGQALCQMLEISCEKRDPEPGSQRLRNLGNDTNNSSTVVGSIGCLPCRGSETQEKYQKIRNLGVRGFLKNYHLT